MLLPFSIVLPRQTRRPFRFLRSTAIGGLLFLLPLIVLGYLLGKVGAVVYQVALLLNEFMGVNTAYGYAVLLIASLALIVLACFGAGVAAQWTLSRRLGEFVERHLMLIFPRYSIYKDQVAGGVGGKFARDRMTPVLVEIHGLTRMALEVERSEELITIYFPGAPDPWSGTVGFIAADRVRPIQAEFGDVMNTFEKLGRDSQAIAGSRQIAALIRDAAAGRDHP